MTGVFTYAFLGLAGAALTIAWARSRGSRAEPRIYAAILIAMQVIYVGFVVAAGAWDAVPQEVLVLGVLTAIALAAGRGRYALLPLGYMAHGLWDLYHGRSGSHYVPLWYAWACVSYDWLCALYFLGRRRHWPAGSAR